MPQVYDQRRGSEHSLTFEHPPSATINEATDLVADRIRERRRNSPIQSSRVDEPAALTSLPMLPIRPKFSLHRISSLDQFISHREERDEWERIRRESLPANLPLMDHCREEEIVPDRSRQPSGSLESQPESNDSTNQGSTLISAAKLGESKHSPGFRHFAAEIGFCFTIAMTQLLAEYLITGFAIELPNLLEGYLGHDSSSMGLFWPASLLSLVLGAVILVFARLSDMYGGYPWFMFGVVWLAIWTLIPGLVSHPTVLDVSRAMQGLAIAAFTPSTFAMVASVYGDGPRRNVVLGCYSACAPIGFFIGILTAGALSVKNAQWYFLIASLLSVTAIVTAYLSVPSDRVRRNHLDLRMDWRGAALIVGGLLMVAYSLAIEPYASESKPDRIGLATPTVLGLFLAGMICLAIAFWIEGWVAKCPLIPFDFFKPKSVLAFCCAALCFYATYGVWLYTSVDFFQNPAAFASDPTGGAGIDGVQLAIWYLPTAVGGIIFCVVSGALFHRVHASIILLASGIAWLGAPLLLVTAPLPLNYWRSAFPSMICATLGIDVTFTFSVIFLSSTQPLAYQGLAGAVCSVLLNLAMSFGLSLSEIISRRTGSSRPGTQHATGNTVDTAGRADIVGYRTSLIYASASAACGLAICLLTVRIPRRVITRG